LRISGRGLKTLEKLVADAVGIEPVTASQIPCQQRKMQGISPKKTQIQRLATKIPYAK
jgi:hypothetical protein